LINPAPPALSWAVTLACLVSLAGPAQARALASDPPLGYAHATEPLAAARQISASGDAVGRPFIIVDKRAARVLAFDETGTLVGETEALLGMAIGDVSPEGIGAMRLADIGPQMRITPAGRFDAHLGRNLTGAQILWVDYDDALSLHAVVTGNARERRLERLASPSVLDNRISYGCINVPAAFFTQVVAPLFAADNGVVYILPEG
jgi:hypothetical protein